MGQQSTHLVVDQHKTHQDGIRGHLGEKALRGDDAMLVRLYKHRVEALLAQALHRLQHRGVLEGGSDHPLAPAALGMGGAEHCPVVALGAARGEVEILPPAADERCRRLGGLLHEQVALQPQIIEGRRVAIMLPHHLGDIVDDPVVHLCGGAVVQIDLLQNTLSPSLIPLPVFPAHTRFYYTISPSRFQILRRIFPAKSAVSCALPPGVVG